VRQFDNKHTIRQSEERRGGGDTSDQLMRDLNIIAAKEVAHLLSQKEDQMKNFFVVYDRSR
jgi:hypothetical protein